MPMVEIYPMTFEPVFRDYIWGGRNLETLYDRGLPEGIVAESWDISAFPGSATRIESGYWKWRTLVDVVGDLGGAFPGHGGARALWHQVPLALQAAGRAAGSFGASPPRRCLRCW